MSEGDLYRSMTPEQQCEDRTIRTLQCLVDCAGRKIVSGALSSREATELAQKTRLAAERIIPDQMESYDMIYGSRFRYWIDHFCSNATLPQGKK
ncbi:MAG: hypothetical protein NTW14_14195 [bacterium]|nr:hypothetical protein [bacterium]